MILILTTVFFLADSVFSDTSLYKTYYLEGMEITATRYTKFPELSTTGINIIDNQTLNLKNPRNAGEALLLIPGINVLNYTVKNETKLGIRGLGFNRNLIMIDGTPVADPWDNSTILNEISLHGVKRVEVIKGSSTLSYGPNTLGGIVNIVTEDVARNQIQFDIETGSFDYRAYSLSGGGDFGMVNSSINYHRTSTDGFIWNTDYKGEDWGGSIQIGRASTLRSSFRYHNAVKGALGQNPGQPWRFPYWKTYHYDVVFKTQVLGMHIGTRYFLNRWKNKLICYSDSALSQEKWVSVHNNQTDGAEIIVDRGWSPFGMVTGGIQVHRARINTTNEGEGEETMGGIFLHNFYALNARLLFTLSVRYDIHSSLENAPGYNVGSRFEPVKNFIIRANYGKVLTYPSLRQLHDNSLPIHTNPNLIPEKSTTFELGGEFTKGQLSLKSVLFNTDTRDLIGRRYLPGDTINEWQYKNIDRTKVRGWESSATLSNLFGFLQFSSFWTYMDARDVKTRHKLEYSPELTMGIQLSCGLPRDINVFGNLRFMDRQLYQDKTGWHTVDAYILCDVGISCTIAGKHKIFLNYNNLFDGEYEIKEDIPGSQREYRGGISSRFL
ncbi:hypothetical protein CH333_06320 [candidate division WOR-3 bacterium JGI_Cruoil_03_44_89]|uniref:TonB-dependent receptor plug domain-containing protein n=1 Tax=candidate division WOR-3 bacterium JGI_Cruoil_03_44_89 TaxID=1973748 RepID=A0A235BRQ7_UNCW3|nr:MAG: hypothetical protein CH333_06320 [candidate division WOR-3 bacterium JGI_Cruoil_03_44_89]